VYKKINKMRKQSKSNNITIHNQANFQNCPKNS